MRIVIDYTPALVQSAGIARYTRELVAALAQSDTINSYVLFSAEAPAGQSLPHAPNLRSCVVPLGNRAMTRLWQRLRVPLPIELFVGRANVVHGPDFILPPVLG